MIDATAAKFRGVTRVNVPGGKKNRDKVRIAVGGHMAAGGRYAPGATLLSALILIAAMLSGVIPAQAAKSAALVVDANTGEVLHSESADAPRYPASLTKMMTLYMVFDAIERKKLSYSTRLRMSPEAAKRPPSKLGLKPGETISVRQAVAALITRSANDVAAMIGEHLAGTESGFARAMTAKAREIGMRSTTFRNASGLPNRSQKTTARDMITLALRMQDQFPNHFRNFRLRTFKWRGRTLRTTNSLLRSFAGMNGIKTGYTRASGFNLVSSVKRGRRHVVAAVFGGSTARNRNAKMRILLTRALKRASTRKTRRPWRPKTKPMLVARPRPAKRPAASRRRVAAAPPPLPRRAEVRQPQPTAAGPNLMLAQVKRVMFHDGRVVVRTMPQQTAASRIVPPRPQLAKPPTSITDILRQTVLPQTAVAAPPRRRAPVPTAGRSGPHVQIGAYFSQREALRRLDGVRAAHEQLLDGRLAITQVVESGSRQLFRARFAGFDLASARQTCQALKARGIDCIVTR
jgi:D-alanyl-D-alanine carboxypeptidase